ncbi:MAG: tetratricopeptide repeat protein [Bdellovibrionota bacterium]
MKIMMILGPLFYSTTLWAFSLTFEGQCEKQDWVKETARTQWGGWVFFPGKGVAQTEDEAWLRAEGTALEKLVGECQFPHKEVKIHERCVEKMVDDHIAYVRLSLLETLFKEARYSSDDLKKKIFNEALHQRYKKFSKLDAKESFQTVDGKSCEEKTAEECYQWGRHEFFAGDQGLSLIFFESACKKGHVNACFNSGLVAQKLGMDNKARGLFTLSCHSKDAQGCLFLGHYEKAAAQKSEALGHFKTACELGAEEACHQASGDYFESGQLALAREYAEKACKKNHPKACYNLGQAFSDKDLAMTIKACELKFGMACYKMGQTETTKKTEYYKKGCEFGQAESCAEVSAVLFDLKQEQSALFYTKMACKLGIIKSCHNSGLLEMKQGRKDEARSFLDAACGMGLTQSCDLLKTL